MFHQRQEHWPSSIQAHLPIQNRRLPWHHICIGDNASPLPRQISLCRLDHTKQLHQFRLSQARTKLIKPTNRLPHLPLNPRTRSEEVSWRNQSIAEAGSTHTFSFVSLGTQLQLFAAALSIFFEKRVCAQTNSNTYYNSQDVTKKSFCNQIALNKFFAAKFLSVIDRRVQRWLRMCKQASISCKQVNNNILSFSKLLDQILNGSFQMNLPASFKNIQKSPRNAPPVEPKQANA